MDGVIVVSVRLCDCIRQKIFMSASFAINKPNRFFLLTLIQMTGFLKQVEVALGENAFYHPNTEDLQVLREVN
ncbi:hypothetical protein IOA21_004175 [Salmonella enterica]|uniref:hypothetical protein n=1 Tax=Salmonella enterica TaxID=28901 RepID=UPI0004120C28|nr:hypothetical protein [Salmonella enterica]EEP8607088.1 hypothetical protein [Salmonella enterica subsp. enterica serovar Eko]EGB8714739.1 hypothetical protein [Salmonella enterica subsp. enterica serovar Cerro]EHE5457744.1 hypothetical protein [Salmonella enterica subsp. enterica serovar Brandenburg]EIN8377405.1 hypothetical protein [Salmonella enterica subsp. enterica serovar Anatum]EIN8481016.1 hypothetical protein [Salmonella enterica subsp. enterica serovar Muenchen]EIT5226576.1 hypoth